jgi:exodeoxyribonuclease VII large subunit
MMERPAGGLRPDILAARIIERRQRVAELSVKVERVVERLIDRGRSRVARADAAFTSLPNRLRADIARQRDQIVNLATRGESGLANLLRRHRQALAASDRVLQSLSYKNVLKRGYAVIRDEGDRPLSNAAQIVDGAALSIEFADGRVKAIAGEEGGTRPVAQKKKPVSKAEGGGQGSLF